ncbi:hypothetical protein CEE37_11905 [candidate division LCP-89 bacterium B3_LCP]|uniref:DUF4145 domain-containing protein n=1 Tax=candidate division LCP-89 bacterium B3_LCP TaxID=2012998 RepID=A0A532UVZ6_UNCL8|nr:MAG: hypothetical protein CEE37_11905 [candidate division LCP-89 bacterium B3_LCP]
MDSWWRLGENDGYHGNELAVNQITCPFCLEQGNYKLAHHREKSKPNSQKILNFDTYECGNCKGYVLVLWSASEFGSGFHNYHVLPWPLRIDTYPNYWPESVGRFWIQAKRNLIQENWDAASLMARSALQAAIRDSKAEGNNLKQEIEYLAREGILPPIMKEWSDALRELGNVSAHPLPDQPPTNPQDASDIVNFLDFLLEYLYTLPHRINEYRKRGDKK